MAEGSEMKERPVWQRQRASLPIAITAKVGKRWAARRFVCIGDRKCSDFQFTFSSAGESNSRDRLDSRDFPRDAKRGPSTIGRNQQNPVTM